MGTTIPKVFSQITKFTNLITFLFQGAYPQGKTGPIPQHLCLCVHHCPHWYIIMYKLSIKLEFFHILRDIYIDLSIFISEERRTSYGKFSEIL